MSFDVTLCHFMSLYVTLCHFMSLHVTIFLFMSLYDALCHIKAFYCTSICNFINLYRIWFTGALFLTNYRIIFKGTPIDPFAAEHTVIRYFPISSLTREKRFTLNEYLSEIEQQLKEGIQIRSNTFQLIRAAFDDEVSYVPKLYWVIKRALQRKLLFIFCLSREPEPSRSGSLVLHQILSQEI